MNIGIVEGHCYLIKDFEGLCKIWRCSKCGVAFNKTSNLKRHKAEVDCSPEPKVICEGKRVEGIISSSDKVFYGTRGGIDMIDAAIAEKHPMVVAWEHEAPNPPKIEFPHQFHPYPGFIVYDFEARMKKVGEQKTQFYEVCSEHVPISVATSDNVPNEPVYLVDEDPKSLVARFLQVLLEKREAILAKVTKEVSRPCDFDRLSNKEKWLKWEQQVPVFGFNSSSYQSQVDHEVLCRGSL